MIPARLQAAREVRGLSRLEAAEKLDVTLGRLRRLESGDDAIAANELTRAALVYSLPIAFFKKPIPVEQLRPGPIWMCGDGPGGTTCSRCPELSERLCDYPLGNGETCDLPLCDGCAVEQLPATESAESIDYCPQHALMASGLVLVGGE